MDNILSRKEMEKPYFKYWGKANPEYPGDPKWHPLVYHSLDVAAVASVWWDASTTIQQAFLAAFNFDQAQQSKLRAWVLFYIAMHDLGKFDLRFQLKAPEALAAAWQELTDENHGISLGEIRKFDHGHAGMAWANREYRKWISHDDASREIWSLWNPWLSAVTGHHGDFQLPLYEGLMNIEADEDLIERDQFARAEFVLALEELFLEPEGLNLQKLPPACSEEAKALLAACRT